MRPDFEIGQCLEDETDFNGSHASLRDGGYVGMFALPEVYKEFEYAHEEEGVVAFPDSPIALDEEKEKLIEVLEAVVNIA